MFARREEGVLGEIIKFYAVLGCYGNDRRNELVQSPVTNFRPERFHENCPVDGSKKSTDIAFQDIIMRKGEFSE